MTSVSSLASEAQPPDGPERPDKRLSARYPLRGAAFAVRTSGGYLEIRFKDVSSGGACGLICEPVRVGDFIIVEFDSRHRIEAEVCWVRRFLVGLRFTNPLNENFVERLRAKA